MTITPPTLIPVTFLYDCETDGIDLLSANITEVCLRVNHALCSRPYFTAYMCKPSCANHTGPYQKPIPANLKRYPHIVCLNKMSSFINKNLKENNIAVLIGYNVKGWDEPVLRSNSARFGAHMPLDRIKFFDLADLAHHLEFPVGTTQQQLEASLFVAGLPANRHRALADVRVVKQIWERMLREILGQQDRLDRINVALLAENAEREVSHILTEYDPSLKATADMIARILHSKEEESLPRQEIMVIIDTETTGLLPKARTHHDCAIRILEIGAKILSPYSGSSYEETFTTLVNPGRVTISAEATAVHGITNADIEGKPSVKEALESFELWIRTSNTYTRMMSEQETPKEPCIVLVGYNNISYDNVLLTEESLLFGVDLKRQLSKGVKKSYDVMPLMSTWYTGESRRPPSNKLQDHARFLEILEDRAHRALGDVETLEKILRKICGPINPVALISEAIQFPSSPGLSAKAIIKKAKEFISMSMNPEEAVKRASLAYKESLAEASASIPKEPSLQRKRKSEITHPPTQDYLLETQDPGEDQVEFI